MNTFEIEYLKIINEENGIKTLCFPTEIKNLILNHLLHLSIKVFQFFKVQ